MVRTILKDLKLGKSETLKEYLKTSDSDSASRAQILTEILQDRDQLSWLFDSVELEREIFSRIPGFSESEFKDLRPHFLHARKFKSHQSLENSYYSQGDQILWNRFFEDLDILPIDKSSHLYLNLKQYLELSNYQKGLKNPEMISKILFPFYKSLKENPAIPFPFLVEILKIVMNLNPNHALAILEYCAIFRQRGEEQSLIHMLCQGFENGIRDREYLLSLVEECVRQCQTSQLSRISRVLFSQNIPHLDVGFYEKMRDLLFHGGLFIDALFYGLKAYSYQNHERSRLLPLRKIFFALGNIPFGEFSYFRARKGLGEDDHEIALLVVRGLDYSSLHYKFRSLDPWKPMDHPFLFLPQAKNPKVELYHPSAKDPCIFYPAGSGPFQLRLDLSSSQLLIKEFKIIPPGEAVAYRFLDFHFESSEEALTRLTPFHFLSNSKAE